MSERIEYVTVLIPAYNSAQYISYAVRSILNQTHKDFELLTIDDGSTDNTEEIVNNFKDSRIVYKKIAHKGLASALNFGLSVASFEWIARLDADDLNTKERLEKQIKYIKFNPDISVLSSWSVYFKNNGKIQYFLKTPCEHEEINKFLDLHNPFNHSAVFYNKNLILNSGYNEELECYEDFELFYKLRDKLKFHILPDFLVYTRLQEKSLTKVNQNKVIFNIIYPNAFEKIKTASAKKDRNYWNNIIAWIYFFYGDKKTARKFLLKDVSIKKIIALIFTYLPQKYFISLINFNIKYRFISLFIKSKKYRIELKELSS